MLKQVVIVAAVLIWANVASPQIEHAPTVEQCQADKRLWLASLESNIKDTSAEILFARAGEMTECLDVDPSNSFKYMNTMEEAYAVLQLRMSHFLVRHHLYAQFKAEDAAGQR